MAYNKSEAVEKVCVHSATPWLALDLSREIDSSLFFVGQSLLQLSSVCENSPSVCRNLI